MEGLMTKDEFFLWWQPYRLLFKGEDRRESNQESKSKIENPYARG